MKLFRESQNPLKNDVLTPARVIALLCKHINVSKNDFFAIITDDNINRPPNISLSNSVTQNYRIYLLGYLLIELNLMTDINITSNYDIYNLLFEKYVKYRTLCDKNLQNAIDRENLAVKIAEKSKKQNNFMPQEKISTAFRLHYKGNYSRMVEDYQNFSNFDYREIIIDPVFLTLPQNNIILYNINSLLSNEVSSNNAFYL